MTDDDILLLLADGVYATQILATQASSNTYYVMREDAQIRGLEEFSGLNYIDYAEMVQLTEQHNPIMTWG